MKIEQCYCGHQLDSLCCHSEWGDREEQHYKSVVCNECGRKNWIKVGFLGSGHDVENVVSIDSIVKKVHEK